MTPSLVRYLSSGEMINELVKINLMLSKLEQIRQKAAEDVKEVLRCEAINSKLDQRIDEEIRRDRVAHPIAHTFLVAHGDTWSPDAAQMVRILREQKVPICYQSGRKPLESSEVIENLWQQTRNYSDIEDGENEKTWLVSLKNSFIGSEFRNYEHYLRDHINCVEIGDTGELINDSLTPALLHLRTILEEATPLKKASEKLKKERSQKRLERQLRTEESQAKKKSAEARIRATAIAYFGKTRRLAREVKKTLREQLTILNTCPYCGGSFGEAPFADHIYPVSHGGLSTFENMVFVCQPCNEKKSNLTVREFIQLTGLDRGKIESNLGLLKKKF